MAYLVGLFLILGLVFSTGLTGHSFEFLGNLNPNKLLHFDQLKNKAIEVVNPKSESEKLISAVKKDQATLEQFLSSDTVKKLDKETLNKAVSAVKETKSNLDKLEQIVKSDKSIVSQVVSKVLNLNSPQESNSPGPTYIPPYCHVQCDK